MSDTLADANAFVGRQAEVALLDAGIDRALKRRGSMFLIAGEPGIGKSRLAEETATEAEAKGATVFWGNATQAEGAPPYWPWVQILRAFLQNVGPPEFRTLAGAGLPHVLRMVPELSAHFPDVTPASVADDAHRFGTYDAVTQLLLNGAAQRPLVLVLEDLHWADVPSLLLLQVLAGAITRSAMVLIGTYRQHELAAGHPLKTQLADFVRRGETVTIELDGLSDREVAGLLRTLTAYEPADDVVRRLQQQTAGNPFFVKELARGLVDDARLARVDPGEAIPSGVVAVLRRRVEALPGECRKMLELAATAGQQLDLELIAAAGGTPPQRLLDLCDEAAACGLVESRHGDYAFAHGLSRDTVYSGLTAAHRAQLHGLIARALESQTQEAAEKLPRLAHHYIQAAAIDASLRPKAIAYASAAGTQAMAELAYEEGVRLLESAVELATDATPPDRAEMLLDLGRARYLAGNVNGAIEVAREVSRIGRQLGSPDLLACAVTVVRGVGGPGMSQEIRDLCEQALRDPTHDPSLMTQVLSQLAVVLNQTSDPEDHKRSLEYSARAMELAANASDIDVRFAALHARQMARAGPEGVSERLEIAQRALDLARESGRRSLEQWGHDWRADALAQLGRLDEAEAELSSLTQLARELHEPLLAWRTLRGLAWIAIPRGRFAEAQRISNEARELGIRVLGPIAEMNYWLHAIVLTQFVGEASDPEGPSEDFMRLQPDFAPALLVGRIPALVARGRLDEARMALAFFTAFGPDGIRPRLAWLAGMAGVSYSIAAVGDAAQAAVAYEALLPYAELNVATGAGLAGLWGSVARYLGMLAGARGRFEDAARHYEAAIAFETSMGAPTFVACSKILYAELLLRRAANDDFRRALQLAAEGLATAQTLGMPPWTDRANAVLRELKAHKVTDNPLSNRELEVAELVASGLSNKAIAERLHLSERTAESHIKNICDKLGFNSRSQVAAWVARRKQA